MSAPTTERERGAMVCVSCCFSRLDLLRRGGSNGAMGESQGNTCQSAADLESVRAVISVDPRRRIAPAWVEQPEDVYSMGVYSHSRKGERYRRTVAAPESWLSVIEPTWD